MNPVVEFASPREGLARRTFAIYPRAYSEAVIKRVQRQGGPEAGSWRILDETRGGAGHAADWTPEMGAAQFALKGGDARLGLLHAALGAAVAGEAGECRLTLSAPVLVGLAGYRLRLEGQVQVSFGADRIRFQEASNGAVQLAFERTPTGWRLAAGAPSGAITVWAPSFLTASGFEDRYVIAATARAGSETEPPSWPPAPADEREAFQTEAADQVSAALALLCGLGPHYEDWIAPIFRGVVAYARDPEDSDRSSSSPAQPGIVSLSFPISTERLAQLLVHELSHQYFFVFNYVAPLTNKDDTTLYYSSLKRRQRRIDKILLALHASANMALYWSDLAAADGLSPEREMGLLAALRHAKHLGAIADQSIGLTPEGRRLWTLQKELLAARGHATDVH